jgi:uncharacterized surface protein with fasciclin (FAS1) repeats
MKRHSSEPVRQQHEAPGLPSPKRTPGNRSRLSVRKLGERRRVTARRAAGTLAVVALAVVALGGCGGDAPAPSSDRGNASAQRAAPNIVEVAQVAGQFSTLIRAAIAADLAETLATGGPFTVFAPTDGAFADLPEGTVEALLADPETLKGILLHHVVAGRFTVEELRGMREIETLHGTKLRLENTADGLTVGGTYLLTANVGASNGIVHVITSVLVP